MTAVQPAVTWVVSWQAPQKRYGRLGIMDGEPGSAAFDTEAEAEREKAYREASGCLGVVVWTMQVVA